MNECPLAIFLFRMATGAGPRESLVATFRSNLGQSILLELEFLAADIIHTVTVEPTVQSLIVLVGIVLTGLLYTWRSKLAVSAATPSCDDAKHQAQ